MEDKQHGHLMDEIELINVSTATKNILTVNGGSSSIKFALFDSGIYPRLIVRGEIERIGTAGATFSTHTAGEDRKPAQPVVVTDQTAAVTLLVDWLRSRQSGGEAGLLAIAHRVVHGGPKYHQPQRLTPALLMALRQLIPLDPLHMPGEILLMEAFAGHYPNVPQVVCFDTAFHHDLPRVARMLAIPRRYHVKGVRRYGFHGLSYQFLMSELRRIDVPAASGRIILAHLGNGASLAAVHNGKPIDTSMGFTPASGVPMGTRSGDIDPGLAGYLARSEGMDATKFEEMVNSQSGLLGLSETSGDMRELLLREKDDARAADAVALFCYQIKKWIGAFAAALGGVDTLVFSGGIGEKAPAVRLRICAGLDFLGIALDPVRNAGNDPLISSVSARVKVRVIPTFEELVMARAVLLMPGITATTAETET